MEDEIVFRPRLTKGNRMNLAKREVTVAGVAEVKEVKEVILQCPPVPQPRDYSLLLLYALFTIIVCGVAAAMDYFGGLR